MEPILKEWEDFARTIEPPALTMDNEALRDHARQMLSSFALDLEATQTDAKSEAKSKGLAKRHSAATAAEIHAESRLLSGYTVVQLVSEYRALRSSVLRLWDLECGERHGIQTADVARFNEAIDQALTESVSRYEIMIQESRNMFLAILAHDLRNPLGTMMTGSRYIMEGDDVASHYAIAATRLFNSARRMNKLVTDLIDFTRTHLGPGIPIESSNQDLVTVIEEVLGELKTAHPEITIAADFPPRLEVVHDKSRIAQVLSNLLGNAIQYGEAGAAVTLSLRTKEDKVIITINNHGPVISPDKLSAIFDPLVRIAAATASPNERSSLGIGLFISREIIQAHGGQILVESNGHDGTTFTICLPANRGIPTLASAAALPSASGILPVADGHGVPG